VKVSTGWRRLRAGGQSRGLGARIAKLEAERKQLSSQVSTLQTTVQELRGLGGRVSELADLVTELLAVEATRADPEFQRLVDQYRGGV
jgi:uncharacterized protein (DUF3084 family)